MYRRVLYTFADVPLNAGRLVVGQVASAALQEHQRRCQERGFDDGEHAPPPVNRLSHLASFSVAMTAPRRSFAERLRSIAKP